MVYVLVIASAFSIQLFVRATLVWQDDCFYGDLYFSCPRAFGRVAVGTGPWHPATMLLPSWPLCNRPDKEGWLLISAAQRLGSVLGMLSSLEVKVLCPT